MLWKQWQPSDSKHSLCFIDICQLKHNLGAVLLAAFTQTQTQVSTSLMAINNWNEELTSWIRYIYLEDLNSLNIYLVAVRCNTSRQSWSVSQVVFLDPQHPKHFSTITYKILLFALLENDYMQNIFGNIEDFVTNDSMFTRGVWCN